MEKKREIDCWRVEPVVEQTLCDIECRCSVNVIVRPVIEQSVKDKFVLADSRDREPEACFKRLLNVIG